MRRVAKVAGISLAALAVAAAVLAAAAYFTLRQSLPQLDGEARLAGLQTPVRVERDAFGIPVIRGRTRPDVARALGFLHAQERFFQMDLLRRSAAGELAEIIGPAAVGTDIKVRIHGFRALAAEVLAAADPGERALLEAYTQGVNAGLQGLGGKPWEYYLLRAEPAPWRSEDTVLVGYAMWLDLQGGFERTELAREAAFRTCGRAGLDFLSPPGGEWDAAIDGSTFPPVAPPVAALANYGIDVGKFATTAQEAHARGSNNWAVSGAHTAHGAALVADDMHLGLAMPNIWYRAAFVWQEGDVERRVDGATLPGTPMIIIGSNGRVAWGFTNSYIDTVDVVVLELNPEDANLYRVPEGWERFGERTEQIAVKGGESVASTVRTTRWGPVLEDAAAAGRPLALRWSAHDAVCMNFRLLGMETAGNVEDAVAVAQATGMPNQNLVAGDASGAIAWTIAGKIPRRAGFDGRLPVSWADGDNRWDGWLGSAEVPVIRNPADGILWTANNRVVGGDALRLLGDGGYAIGARARQIRDGLRARVASGRPVEPADLLAIQLDDRALFLERWHRLLVSILDPQAVAGRAPLEQLRAQLTDWPGRADPGSRAYAIVRDWRREVAGRVLGGLIEPAAAVYPAVRLSHFPYEDALWSLVEWRPQAVLGHDFGNWNELLLDAAAAVAGTGASDGGQPPAARGERNVLQMRHPFSMLLPGFVANFLDAPAQSLPGDRDMPRVQAPDFGASQRMVVAPGHEEEGIFHMPGGQSGHPLSAHYLAGHEAWARGAPAPFLPGQAEHVLVLRP